MQKVFGTASLDLRDLLVSTGIGLLIFPMIWIEKKVQSFIERK
jgi:hypothetical protein